LKRLVLVLVLAFTSTPTAEACPRCDREGLNSSLVEGAFLHFQQITRTLRVRREEGGETWEDRIVVVGGVSPERDGEAVSWGSLEQGEPLELEVHETEQSRYIVRVKVVTAS